MSRIPCATTGLLQSRGPPAMAGAAWSCGSRHVATTRPPTASSHRPTAAPRVAVSGGTIASRAVRPSLVRAALHQRQVGAPARPGRCRRGSGLEPSRGTGAPASSFQRRSSGDSTNSAASSDARRRRGRLSARRAIDAPRGRGAFLAGASSEAAACTRTSPSMIAFSRGTMRGREDSGVRHRSNAHGVAAWHR